MKPLVFFSSCKVIFCAGLLILMQGIAVLKCCAQPIIAQEINFIPGNYYGLSNFTPTIGPPPHTLQYQNVSQIFKATATTNIASIALNIQRFANAGNINIEIYSCTDVSTWATLLGIQSNVAINALGWITSDVSALNIGVTSGNFYGFRLIPQAGFSGGIGIVSDAYPDGTSWVSGGTPPGTIDGAVYSFIITGSVPLPVTLFSFTAQIQDKEVLLNWKTASEQNSKSFTVQHSTDQRNWENIHTAAAAGNSNTPINYSFTDITPSLGVNYYRLLQTDIDSKTSYSKIDAVNLATGKQEFNVIANPVSNGVLWVQVNDAATLSLYSSNGQRLWVKQFGAGVQNISMSGYAKGLYLLKGNKATATILVQ